MDSDIFSKFSLKGKVALITGASRGIGEGIASAYSKAGAKVVICSRKNRAIEEASRKIMESGGEVLGLAANVSASNDRARLIKDAMDWAGQINILVNNVGGNPHFGPLAELAESAWDKVMDINLKTSFIVSQSVYHAWMKDHGGTIINVSSVGAFETIVGINAYNIAKAALIHLTRCLAREWGPNGIRVNALAPGLVKTKMSQALWDGPLGVELTRSNPIGRIAEIDDIECGALFLASDASSFVTGHTLVIDGGQLVR